MLTLILQPRSKKYMNLANSSKFCGKDLETLLNHVNISDECGLPKKEYVRNTKTHKIMQSFDCGCT